MAISIKNWKRFQHFRDRRPPWIKLYRDLMEDPDWHALNGDIAKTLVSLWLMASEADGYLPDIRKISFRLRLSEDETMRHINCLGHWLTGISGIDTKASSDRYQDDAPETETETETEEDTAGAVPSKYAFEQGVIRLTSKDLLKWKKAFSHLDVEAELIALSEWADRQGQRWFFAVSGALAKRNREVGQQKVAPEYKYASGIPGVL